MGKQMKVLVVAIVAILVVTVGFTIPAFADEGNGGQGPAQAFISKVATILGLGEEQVASAFEQSRQEMQDEALERHLDNAVEKGRLTEEQAAEIEEWWQARPEALEGFGAYGHFQPRNAGRYQRFHWPVGQPAKQPWLSQIFDERLSGTVTSIAEDTGIITLVTEEGNDVTFRYTSNTVFALRGTITSVEVGQTVVAWCWKDAEGNPTAKLVKIGTP